jgi:hypothetical protein
MNPYSDLSLALLRARERSAAKPSDDQYLLEILELSYGIHKVSEQIVYRPFYAAAKFLQQARKDQTISQATDVKFTGQKVPIESLLDLQRSLDFDLIINPAFRIFAAFNIGNLQSEYDAAVMRLKTYQPRGYS